MAEGPSSSHSPPKKPTLGQPWSHIETLNLIKSYQEKWYSLNRGQLKASQWEQVAITLAKRCNFDPPSKTATQCRHKIEKLRKRYRTEKQRPSPSPWPFFKHMDNMERGSLKHSDTTTSNDDDDDDGEDDEEMGTENVKSIDHILNRPMLIGGDVPRFSRNPRFRKRGVYGEEERRGFDDRMLELAEVVREFGEAFVRIENMKMEMMGEVESMRMEMEVKRTEMILESQRGIADAIVRAFWSEKKAKKSEDD